VVCSFCEQIIREKDFSFSREDEKPMITILCPKCRTEYLYKFRRKNLFK